MGKTIKAQLSLIVVHWVYTTRVRRLYLALQSFQRAVEIRRKTLGENHPGTAVCYNNIGYTQQAIGDFTSALQSFQRLIDIDRENNLDTASSYTSITGPQNTHYEIILELYLNFKAKLTFSLDYIFNYIMPPWQKRSYSACFWPIQA